MNTILSMIRLTIVSFEISPLISNDETLKWFKIEFKSIRPRRKIFVGGIRNLEIVCRIRNPCLWNRKCSSRNLKYLNGLESGIQVDVNQPPSLHQAAPPVRKKIKRKQS